MKLLFPLLLLISLGATSQITSRQLIYYNEGQTIAGKDSVWGVMTVINISDGGVLHIKQLGSITAYKIVDSEESGDTTLLYTVMRYTNQVPIICIVNMKADSFYMQFPDRKRLYFNIPGKD